MHERDLVALGTAIGLGVLGCALLGTAAPARAGIETKVFCASDVVPMPAPNPVGNFSPGVNACIGLFAPTAVNAGGNHTCLSLPSGQVDCYAYNSNGQAADYSGGNAVAVSAGSIHTCVLLSTGNVHCYGNNPYGQAADYTHLI